MVKRKYLMALHTELGTDVNLGLDARMAYLMGIPVPQRRSAFSFIPDCSTYGASL